jgi:hypothetical protein
MGYHGLSVDSIIFICRWCSHLTRNTTIGLHFCYGDRFTILYVADVRTFTWHYYMIIVNLAEALFCKPEVRGYYFRFTLNNGREVPSLDASRNLNFWISCNIIFCSLISLLLGSTVSFRKNGVFWVVTPCGSCKNRRFGGTWHLLHQGDKNRWTRNNTSCN